LTALTLQVEMGSSVTPRYRYFHGGNLMNKKRLGVTGAIATAALVLSSFVAPARLQQKIL